MSLARTALRIAAIAALNSHPTIDARCAGRIYDSRVGDFDAGEPVPAIVVTTEQLSGEAWNPQNGGAPFDDACDLVLEIAQTQIVHDGDDSGIYHPETDGELETELDLLEQCAEWMLTLGMTHPRARQYTPAGRVLVKSVTRRVSKRTSDRFSSDDIGAKLAIHLLTFRVELKGENIDMRILPTGPFAALPDPLRTVAESLPPDSPAHATCVAIAAALEPPPDVASTSPPFVPPAPIPGTLPVELDLPIVEEGSCAST